MKICLDVLIAWDIPMSELQWGAYDSLRDDSTHPAVVLASPFDQLVVFSVSRITGVANLHTKDVV